MKEALLYVFIIRIDLYLICSWTTETLCLYQCNAPTPSPSPHQNATISSYIAHWIHICASTLHIAEEESKADHLTLLILFTYFSVTQPFPSSLALKKWTRGSRQWHNVFTKVLLIKNPHHTRPKKKKNEHTLAKCYSPQRRSCSYILRKERGGWCRRKKKKESTNICIEV